MKLEVGGGAGRLVHRTDDVRAGTSNMDINNGRLYTSVLAALKAPSCFKMVGFVI